MKLNRSLVLTWVTIAAALVAVPAVSSTTSNLPRERTQGGVSYMSGGIGTSQSTAMQHEESRFPLTLEFVERGKPDAEYLANVDVKIRNDAHQVVLDTVADGPFLLANVPPGKYTITAMSEGRTMTRAVNLPAGKHERVLMEW
jgi:hypothetical protein